MKCNSKNWEFEITVTVPIYQFPITKFKDNL